MFVKVLTATLEGVEGNLVTVETDYGKKQFVFDKIKEIAEEKDLLMINEV